MTLPKIQWLGRGLGHIGSTSNLGACAPAACTTALWLSSADAAPKPAISTRNVAPTQTLRFRVNWLFIGASIHETEEETFPANEVKAADKRRSTRMENNRRIRVHRRLNQNHRGQTTILDLWRPSSPWKRQNSMPICWPKSRESFSRFLAP